MPTETATIPESHSTPSQPSTDIAHGAPSTGAKPSSFRPPNPAFDAVVERMYKRGGVEAPKREKSPKPEASKPAELTKEIPNASDNPADAKPELDSPDIPPKKEDSPKGDKPSETKEGEETPPETTGKGKKISVYRLLDQWQKTAGEYKAKAEAATQELEKVKAGKPAELPKEVTERIAAQDAKIQEYEKKIQLLDYQNSDEFVTKHLKPYNDEYTRTMQRLQGIPVIQPDGTTRNIEPNDIFKLLVLPAGEAEVKAKEMFGDFSGTVVRRVEKLQDLFDAQQTALKDAKENGAARLKEQREAMEAQQKESQKFVTETWEKENRLALTDDKYGKFFTPVEGDQKGNAALAQGLKTVSEAFSANPNDPKLTPEERARIIRRHAKIFNAAAGFPRMVQWLEERDTRIAELEAELKEYKESEPPSTGATKPAIEKKGGDFFSSFTEKLSKRSQR